MKDAVITLTILVATSTITTAYLLWTSPHVAGNFTESFGPAAARSGSSRMLKNATTPFTYCPTDLNSSWQTRPLIVIASALFSDSEDGDEEGEGAAKDEEKKGDDKNEDQGVDRLWDACKCG
ncbi:MAG: hypothetical protein M1305_02550 [Candidatus Marsarchaeota archaeon]|nr:hypothetical protein [Candidatus Marsarchaeota archaeon]